MTTTTRRRTTAALAALLATGAAALAAVGGVGPALAQQPKDAPAASAAPGAPIPGAAAMLAHRAAYRLTLDRARDGSDVAQATGAMLFEVLDACEGWTTRQRLTLELLDRDGNRVETASDYATYESKDGRSLRFSMTQSSQGAVSQRIVGEATLEADGSGVARYEQPTARTEALPPGTMLPMLHTIRALEAARAGRRIMVGPLMDGTSEDGAQDSTTVIASWDPNPQAAPRFPELAGQASARMRIAFFDRGAGAGQGGGAAAPEYEVGLRYFANGVADELRMDFGEFSLDGRLETLEAVPGGC